MKEKPKSKLSKLFKRLKELFVKGKKIAVNDINNNPKRAFNIISILVLILIGIMLYSSIEYSKLKLSFTGKELGLDPSLDVELERAYKRLSYKQELTNKKLKHCLYKKRLYKPPNFKKDLENLATQLVLCKQKLKRR